MAKYLDYTGLGHYDEKIKAFLDEQFGEKIKIKTIKLNANEVAPTNGVVSLIITAQTVGADPTGTASGIVASHETDSNAHATVFAGYVPRSMLGSQAGNIPVLGENGKMDVSMLPSIALMDTFPVKNQSEMLALDAQRGDIAIRSDIKKSFILAADDPTALASWKELLTPDCNVTSVAGKTGTVVLVKADVGLGNVDNTSDKNKPISTATQTALDKKLDKTDSRIAVGDTTINGDVVMAINHVYGIAATAKSTAETANIDIGKIVDGTTTVGKATKDGNGNNIVNTYATKKALETALETVQAAMEAITTTEIDNLFA